MHRIKRLEYWKNAKGEYNYRAIGMNGKVIASINQGFKSYAGVYKNIFLLGWASVPMKKIQPTE
jgi:hypothetical protein